MTNKTTNLKPSWKTVRANFTMPPQTLAKLRRLAVRDKVSASAKLRELIEQARPKDERTRRQL